MNITEHIATAVWLLVASTVAGAAIASRAAFQLRHYTKDRTIYQWFSALGTGLALYAIATAALVFNSILNDPVDCFPTEWFVISIPSRLLQSAAMWLIALALIDSTSSGRLRNLASWILVHLHLSDPKLSASEPSESPESPDEPKQG